MDLLAFDTETDGTDPLDARIVSACCVWFAAGEPVRAQR
jgi:hypothetical protein